MGFGRKVRSMGSVGMPGQAPDMNALAAKFGGGKFGAMFEKIRQMKQAQAGGAAPAALGANPALPPGLGAAFGAGAPGASPVPGSFLKSALAEQAAAPATPSAQPNPLMARAGVQSPFGRQRRQRSGFGGGRLGRIASRFSGGF